jgi:hypothetical protein
LSPPLDFLHFSLENILNFPKKQHLRPCKPKIWYKNYKAVLFLSLSLKTQPITLSNSPQKNLFLTQKTS